jgi:ornithine carbamoyltransferase
MFFDENRCGPLRLVTLWSVGSLFLHSTVDPARTRSTSGLIAKLWYVTLTSPETTGAVGDGVAKAGLASTVRCERLVVELVLAAVVVAAVVEPPEVEPQPQSTSVAQAMSGITLCIGSRSHIAAGPTAQTPRLAGPMSVRHFLTGAELSAAELAALLDRAAELKRDPLGSPMLAGRSVALIFQKPSTRTRVSFEVGVSELGGNPLILRPDELQLSRGEALQDTALVLSRHVAAIGVRTGPDAMLEELARYSSVPIINMLTALHHPCQALADLLTLREAYGSLEGRRLAYVGDGNNVARSLAILGPLAGLDVALASPEGYRLEQEPMRLEGATGTVTQHADPREAVAGADAVYTDVWVSMGDEDTAEERRGALAGYRVDDALLDLAAPDAFAMHDLPAHPGDEITAEVLYGSRQRIWDQAENRRHAQKALLELLVGRVYPMAGHPPVRGAGR